MMYAKFCCFVLLLFVLTCLLSGCLSSSNPASSFKEETSEISPLLQAQKIAGQVKTWALPKTAKMIKPDIFELGRQNVNGKMVTGYAIIHRKDNFVKPVKPPKDPIPDSSYTYLAAGAKWKIFDEPYYVDPTHNPNDPTLTDGLISAETSKAVDQWEDAADGKIDGNKVEIFGDMITATLDGESIGESVNNQNEVIFASIDDPGVIAVTFVWGIFGGPPKFRELVEWDQIYDDDGDWVWGVVQDGVESNIMDFANIATHEIGHSMGMGHVDLIYTEETMYPYADFGEIKKRGLYYGDIAGINNLY